MSRSRAVPPETKKLLRSLPGQNLLLLPDAPTFSIVAVNDALCEALQTGPEQLIGKSIFDFLPNAAPANSLYDGAGLETALQQALSEKVSQELPVQKLRVQQKETGTTETRFWHPKTIPLFDDDGNVAYLLHSVADVTAGIRENEAQYCSRLIGILAQTGNSAIWEWNLRTNLVNRFGNEFFRPFAAKLLTVSSPETWTELIHPEDHDRVMRHFESSIADPEVKNLTDTYRLRKTNGTFADISDQVTVLREADGTATFLYGIATDITLRKKIDIEREMQVSNLQKENFELRQFAYITTHNLRTPIANLVALSKLLDKSRVEDPLTRNILEKYKEATQQLNKNVNELFELLKQSAKQESQVKVVALDEVFKQVTASMGSQILDCGAEIRSDFSAGKTVNFIPGYLHSILLNLLSNAIKYRSPDRKLKVQVRTELKDGTLLLHFADNGLGIDLKKFGDKVFGLYQQFHDHPESTGLGLHIVATQVKAMDGNIRVDSAPGSGTTFTIQFKN